MANLRQWINLFINYILKDEWHCPPSISRGKIIDTTVLPEFLFIENEVIKDLENNKRACITLDYAKAG
ncbi:MAG: hypothetical protein Q8942_11975, partial [Bacillota bacterium]|nr:hypothetical protein [Bacillota bacterium]